MSAKKKPAKKQPAKTTAKRGRPSKFQPAMIAQARFLAEKGCTDAELGEFFGVCEATINTWKIEHPGFLESIKEGKAESDSKVVRSLFERATGYSHPDTHIAVSQGDVIVTPTIKHYPPDTTACIFWLKNRRPEEWREKVALEGANGGPVEVEITIGGDHG